MAKRPNRKKKMPQPNVTFRASLEGGELTPADILGMICNPVYAGVGPYPALMSDEEWVAAAATAIRKEGPEQFLVNMLYMLRKSLGDK